MLPTVLVLSFVVCVLGVAVLRERLGVGQGLREALVPASAVFGTLVVAFTEILSSASLLSFGPLLACWLLLLAGSIPWVLLRRDRLRGWPGFSCSFGPAAWVLLGLCVLLVGSAAACAVCCPPNNWDSMAYHLPRQVYWMQQGHVGHFATPDHRLTSMPPFSEFLGVQLMILSGGDAWANLVQWGALVLTMSVVSLLAKEVGLGVRGQLLAALLVVMNPMAYLQASSTKNDLMVSLWVCCGAWWALRSWAGAPLNLIQIVFVGLNVGLLFLTKGTGYLFALPIAAAVGLGLLIKQRRLIWAAVSLMAVCVLLLNVPHFARNFGAYGSPLGYPFPVANETHRPEAVFSVMLRNIFIHLGTPSNSLNTSMTKLVQGIHDWLGISSNDLRSTFHARPFEVGYFPNQEDLASAPVHVLLALAFTVWLLAWGWQWRMRIPWVYLSISYACFFVFCFLLKWQPWHARLQLPILCLFAVGLAWFCSRCLGPKITFCWIVGFLIAWTVPALECNNRSLPLLLRCDSTTIQFAGRPDLKGPCQQTVDCLAQLRPRRVGLLAYGRDYWVYPLQRMILSNGMSRPYFTYAIRDLQQPGAKEDGYPPDVIIALGPVGPTFLHPASGVRFVEYQKFGSYVILVPENDRR